MGEVRLKNFFHLVLTMLVKSLVI